MNNVEKMTDIFAKFVAYTANKRLRPGTYARSFLLMSAAATSGHSLG